ncbi:MAG: PAS domain S-box protein [Gemmatimonadaceae bacterium]|nr:PAS domain S-box protein [Gemmatimonadaceae bacterium]
MAEAEAERDDGSPAAALIALWREARTASALEPLLTADTLEIVRDTAWRIISADDDRLAAIRLQAVLATTPVGVVRTDEVAGTAIVNAAAAGYLGCASGAIPLAAFGIAMHALMARAADAEAIVRAATACLTRVEADNATWRWDLRATSGIVLEVSTRAVREQAHHGRLWTFGDVTRDAANHATLVASEERYRLVTESMQDIVSLHEPDSTPLYVSPSVERVLGLRAEALLGTALAPYVHADDRAALADARRQVLDGAVVGPVIWRCLHPDGAERVLESVLTPYRDVGGTVWRYQTTTRDVTARVRAEAQLRARDERRQHAHRLEALGQLAGGVAHDFNNLLTVLQGNLAHVRAAIADGGDGEGELQAMADAIRRAASLTNQLLAFSRQQVLEQADVAVDAIVRHVNQLLRRALGEQVTLDVRLHAGTACIRVDAGQFEQALINLVLNARDAMPDGGTLAIETDRVADGAMHRMTADALRGRPVIVLRVRDSGTGMDEATRQKAFEPFFTTKDVGKGSGLGLASVYGFVRQSRGACWIDSVPGEGTTVTMAFPESAHRVPSREVGASVPVAPPAPGRILLVEDQTELRALIERILTRAGHTVLLAANGAEALALVADAITAGAPPLAIVSDVVMPVLGGGSFVRQLRALLPATPLLLVSGYTATTGDASGLLAADLVGPTDFLAKPFSPSELTARLDALIARPHLAT